MRRKNEKKTVDQYPPGAAFHLLTGRDYFKDGFGRDANLADLADAWAALRGEVFRMLAERHARGSTIPQLPAAWWQFEGGGWDRFGNEAERIKEIGIDPAAIMREAIERE